MGKIDEILEDINALEEHDRLVLLSKLYFVIYKSIPLDYIQKLVCNYYGFTTQQVQFKTRIQEIVLARHLMMYLARKYTNHSLSVIGKFYGGKDHATVIHAERRIDKLLREENPIKKVIEILSKNMETTASLDLQSIIEN